MISGSDAYKNKANLDGAMWAHMLRPLTRSQSTRGISLLELAQIPQGRPNEKTTALVREAIARSTSEYPAESTPGEVRGIFGEQDSHQLGCAEDERAPVRDPKMTNRLVMAKRAADGLVAENKFDGIKTSEMEAKDDDTDQSSILPAPPVLGKPLAGQSQLHDDCSGTLTVNTLSVMSDNEIIACTGRTREEMLAGSSYSGKAGNAVASPDGKG